MPFTTTISLPKNLAQEVEKQVKEGNFASRSEFFRAAVKAYLRMQKGEISWDVLSAPFRAYAKAEHLTETKVDKIVKTQRHAKKSPTSRQ